MKLCWNLYKLADSSRKWDWYVIEAVSHWQIAKGDPKAPAPIIQSLQSQYQAWHNTQAGTRTYTSNKDCGRPFSIGFSLSFFSISSTQKVCDGNTVRRTAIDNKGAVWRSEQAGQARTVSTVYSQKLRQGDKPTFSYAWLVPRYSYTWSSEKGVWVRDDQMKTIIRKIRP